VVTTDSRHDRAVAPNRLARDFRAPGPNQKWASDITYIRTGEGWLYLAAVMDLYSRRIVGWSMSERIDADLVCQALRMGLGHRRPDLGLLHHSDQGVQYTADSFVHLLESHRILASMSRRGDCWDNAVVESFFGSLKTEWLAGRPLPTRQVARQELFTYIEIFYNRIRRHASLGYVSPVAYEARSETAKQDQAA
jgi:putative transposase